MGSLKIQASIDSKEVVKGLKDIGKGLDNIEEEAQAAATQLGQMLKDRNASTNYRKQLSQLQRTIQDLTITYRELSDEEKNSEFGKTLKGRIDEMTATASKWKDAMMDVQDTIRRGASDTLYFDASLQGIQLVTGAAQTLSGVLGLTSGNTEKMVKAMTAIQSLQGLLTFAQQMQNALQGQSALMKVIIGLRNKMAASMGLEYSAAKKAAAAHIEEEMVQQRLIVTKNEAVLAENNLLTAKERAVIQSRINTANIKLETLAKQKEAVATVQATAAQKALIAVKMASPYVLAATAITTLIVAVLRLTRVQRELNNVMKEAAPEAGKAIAQFRLLQQEYESLSDEASRKQWFEENKSAAESLVGALDGINDCDRVFIEQSDKVEKLILKRAMLMAASQRYADEWVKVMEEYSRKSITAGEYVPATRLNEQGIKVDNMFAPNVATLTGASGVVNTKVTEEIADQYNESLLKGLQKKNPFLEALEKMITDLNNEVKRLMNEINPPQDGPLGDEIKAAEGSLAYYESKIGELNEALKKMNANDEKYKDVLEEKIRLEKEYAEALDNTRKIAKEVKYGATEQLPVVNATIKGEIEVDKSKPVLVSYTIDREGLRKAYDDAARKISQVQKDLSIGIIDQEQARREIDAINALLRDKGIGPIKVDLNGDAVTQLEKMKGLVGELSGFSGIGSIYTSFRDLGDAIDDAKDGVEGFFTAFDTVIRGIQAAIGVVEAFTNVTKMMGAASKAAAAAQIKQQAAADKTTASNAGAAVSGLFASNAFLGIAGVAIAAALAGLVIAQIAKAKKANFASGGIVPGNSFSGDHVIAGLNSGEMVLNKSQQKNLFDMLDHGASGNVGVGGQVEFEIRGEKLYGVLKNYEQKRKRV